MPQVSAALTPYTPAEQAAALVPALEARLGRPPELALVELCHAQLMLENNRGKGLWNNNPGNVTTGDTTQPFYILSKLHTDAMGKILSEGDPGAVVLHFHAFDTLAEGMSAYCAELSRRPSMLAAGAAGDALAFARAIRSSGYTPGIDPPAVARSLASVVREFRAARIFEPFGLAGPGASLVVSSSGSPVMGLLLILASSALAYYFRGWSHGA